MQPSLPCLIAIAQGEFQSTYEGSRRDEYVKVLRSYVEDFGGTLQDSPRRLVVALPDREAVVSWR